jgi:hypothetical protein
MLVVTNKLFLKGILYLDEKDITGHTPFHYCLSLQEPIVIKHLLENYLIDLSIPYPNGDSAIEKFLKSDIESAYSRTDILKALLKAGCDPTIPDSNGYYPMELALQVSDLESLLVLVEFSKLELLRPSSISKLLSFAVQECYLSENQKEFRHSALQLATVTINRLSGPLLYESKSSEFNSDHPSWLQPMKYIPFDTITSILNIACYFGRKELIEAILNNNLFQQFIESKKPKCSYSYKLARYLQRTEITTGRSCMLGADVTHLLFMNIEVPYMHKLDICKLLLEYTTDLNWNIAKSDGLTAIQLGQVNNPEVIDLIKSYENDTSNEKEKVKRSIQKVRTKDDNKPLMKRTRRSK